MIIVAGHRGLLGNRCLKRLQKNHEAYGFDRGDILHPDTEVLINCAGYVSFGSLCETTEENLDRLLDSNIKFAWKISKEFISNGGKHIIHIGSTRSVSVAPQKALYSASKHALLAIHRSINIDYKNVNSSIICPGSFTNKDTISNVIDTIEFVIDHPTIQEVVLDGQI